MWLIYKKEMLELFRDKKTIMFMVVLPVVIFPLIIGLVAFFGSAAVEKAESKVLKFAFVGQQSAPAIYQAMVTDTEKFEEVTLSSDANYAEAIKNDTVDFVLVVPDSFSDDVLATGQHTLTLYLNDAGLNKVHARVNEIVQTFSEKYQLQAFEQLNLDQSQQRALIEPIVIERENVADDREVWGERLGGMLPYFIFFLCLQGAMVPAADIGAGEKERGTLETLLISPIERYKLVIGKFLTIGTAGVISALVTVSSLAVWGVLVAQGMAIEFVVEIMSMVGVADFVLIFLMLVPVVAIFASVLLSLSIYARSFKESQSYMGALMMVIIFPVIIAMMPGVELEGGWIWVPLTNVALAMKELVKGTMDYFALFGIFASTTVIAGAMLSFCVYWFNKEKVLFR